MGGALSVELQAGGQARQGGIIPFKSRTPAHAIWLHTSEAPSIPPLRPTSAGTEGTGLWTTPILFILESKCQMAKQVGAAGPAEDPSVRDGKAGGGKGHSLTFQSSRQKHVPLLLSHGQNM